MRIRKCTSVLDGWEPGSSFWAEGTPFALMRWEARPPSLCSAPAAAARDTGYTPSMQWPQHCSLKRPTLGSHISGSSLLRHPPCASPAAQSHVWQQTGQIPTAGPFLKYPLGEISVLPLASCASGWAMLRPLARQAPVLWPPRCHYPCTSEICLTLWRPHGLDIFYFPSHVEPV